MRPSASPSACDSVSPQPPPSSCGCVVMPLEFPGGQAPRPGPYSPDDIDCPLFEPISPQAREMLLDMRRERDAWDAEVERRFRVVQGKAQSGRGGWDADASTGFARGGLQQETACAPKMREELEESRPTKPSRAASTRARQGRSRDFDWDAQEGAEKSTGAAGTWDHLAQMTCDGWSRPQFVAKLIDPGADAQFTNCETEPDTSFRLYCTSVATLRLRNGKTRLYFFDGRVKSGDYPDLPFPQDVTKQSNGYGTPKFASEIDLFGEPRAFRQWWRADYADVRSVRNLHFCKDLVGFLDSEDDGQTFPLYTPILYNRDRRIPCDFTGLESRNPDEVRWSWSWSPKGEGNGRAGWRSTVIPCNSASVVYESHAVVRLEAEQDLYVMLAVACDGRGRNGDPNGRRDAVKEDSSCQLCAPILANCLDGSPVANQIAATPTTDLVTPIPRTRIV